MKVFIGKQKINSRSIEHLLGQPPDRDSDSVITGLLIRDGLYGFCTGYSREPLFFGEREDIAIFHYTAESSVLETGVEYLFLIWIDKEDELNYELIYKSEPRNNVYLHIENREIKGKQMIISFQISGFFDVNCGFGPIEMVKQSGVKTFSRNLDKLNLCD